MANLKINDDMGLLTFLADGDTILIKNNADFTHVIDVLSLAYFCAGKDETLLRNLKTDNFPVFVYKKGLSYEIGTSLKKEMKAVDDEHELVEFAS